MDYVKISKGVQTKINKYGRNIRLVKMSQAVVDPAKPWKGPQTLVPDAYYDTKGVFAVPATSIPTESRGLAFDWVSKDLLSQARHVILVSAFGAPDLRDYTSFIDSDGTSQGIIWGQLLKPGDVGLLYVFGTLE